MFKVGDIVRCKTDNYGITSYKRPCEVVGIVSDKKIDVRCLGGDGQIFEVLTKLFELVPPDEILTKGMDVMNDEGEKYKFVRYRVNGINVSHPRFWDDFIPYDNIRYLKKFVV